MTRDEMKSVFGILIDMYPSHRDTPPEKITTLINFWHSEFKHIDNDTFGNAVRQVVRTSKFFPTIAEVFEVLNETDGTIIDADAEFQKAIETIKKYPIRSLDYICPQTGELKTHTTTLNHVLSYLEPSIARIVRAIGVKRMMSLDDRIWVRKEFTEMIEEVRIARKQTAIQGGLRGIESAQSCNRRIG